MKKHTLSATPRVLVGRKVKKLRAQGLVPATIYGKKSKSVSISVKIDDFNKIYKEAGESGLIELTLDKVIHPVLIHNLQVDPIAGNPLHVEFYQVDLKEKVHTKVPVEFTGEPAAVANKIGVLLTITDEVKLKHCRPICQKSLFWMSPLLLKSIASFGLKILRFRRELPWCLILR